MDPTCPARTPERNGKHRPATITAGRPGFRKKPAAYPQGPMDDTRRNRVLPPPLDAAGRRLGAVLALLLLAAGLTAATAPPACAQEPAQIRGVQLRKEGERLTVQFQLSAPANFQVVGNVLRRVLVVKFTNAQAALSDGRREIALNDPYIVGISFEQVGTQDTWAKLRLRTPALAFSIVAPGPTDQVQLALVPGEAVQGIVLTGVRLGPHRGGTRLVLELSDPPQIEESREGDVHLVRLKGVTSQLALPIKAEDERIAVQGVERDGRDTLLRVQLKQPGLGSKALVLPAPARVVLDYRQPGEVVTGAPAAAPAPGATGAPAEPGTRRARPPSREPSLESLLGREKNPLISANYELAEREFRGGNFERANLLFLRVFDTQPNTQLGVRAFFRAADSQYERNVAAKANNFHDVIINYQSAIRSAEKIGYETDAIARAFFQIGRAYQRMGFHFEANVHYQLLQERFPDNYPYTQDSYYYQGRNFLELQQDADAVKSFNEFLVRDGDPELTGPAHYHLADAFFSLKRFVEAKTEFDKGRRLAPDYADSRPLLLFHEGETYYENAEFDVARLLYRTLLDHYPDKSYTKLVGLRLGDFLREEGKEEEALKVYRQVIQNAPLEIRLRGKLRIANVLGERPFGTDLPESLKLFDEVIAEGQGNAVAQEALLRKALVLTQHGQYQASIDTFEKLATDYPKSPFNRENLIRANIEEDLKSLVDREFTQEKFWDVAKLYTRYRDKYFPRFPFPYTVFQVGKAYQRLGLYDEAVGMYDEILRDKPGTLATLVDYQKALAFYERDNLGKAEELLLKFIQDHKSDVYTTDARMLLGKAYATGRRYDDALNAYRILAQDFERSQDPVLSESISEVYFELGQTYKELGRNKEALDAFQASVDNFHHPIQGPNVPDFVILAQFRIGDMLYELGQDREALDAYQRAIAQYGQHERAPWARYQMGLIYRRMGDDRKALDEFNSLVELSKSKPGELWESLARQNQRDLVTKLNFQDYLKQ
jgi:tetratricopeptide (TPR) repeat protein